MEFKRLDIILYDFGERKGNVQGGLRPAMVMQNNRGNRHSPTLIVAPISASENKINRTLPTHVELEKELTGLPYNSILMLEQLFTINKDDVHDGLFLRNKQHRVEEKINEALRVSVGV